METNKTRVVKVIVEDAGTNLSAYIVGAPIITVGNTIKEVSVNMKEAIELYLADNPTPCELLCGEYKLVFEMAEEAVPEQCEMAAVQSDLHLA